MIEDDSPRPCPNDPHTTLPRTMTGALPSPRKTPAELAEHRRWRIGLLATLGWSTVLAATGWALTWSLADDEPAPPRPMPAVEAPAPTAGQ